MSKDTSRFTNMLPFFGTDYGLCTLIKPQITFDRALDDVPFVVLMKNFTKTIQPGIQLGKENGLSILLDTEVKRKQYTGRTVSWDFFRTKEGVHRTYHIAGIKARPSECISSDAIAL